MATAKRRVKDGCCRLAPTAGEARDPTQEARFRATARPHDGTARQRSLGAGTRDDQIAEVAVPRTNTGQ